MGIEGTDTDRVVVEGPLLTVGDSGKTASIGSGELLTISLNAQVSTGYSWQVDSIDTTVLKLAGREHVSAANLGGQDIQLLRFAGVAKGQTTITLTYRRSWEPAGKMMADGTTEPVPTFTTTVDVAGAFTGKYTDPSAIPATPLAEPALMTGVSALPSSYFYCNTSTCTPIKDQGQCGSCWAFATVGVMEQVEKKTNGSSPSLAEQHLLSCNTSSFNCTQGGNQGFPWYYTTKDKAGLIGTVYTSDYPYTASDSSCQSKTHHEKITGWTQMTSGIATTAQLKQAILDHGAIWVAVCADSSWDNYSGGVYNGSSGCGQTNHAIVLTGWDDSTGTFLLRNSWGKSWGESGYMRIKYGVNSLGDSASYITYSGSCTPNCTGKVCGDDGCGGSCGTCPSGQACNSSGQCGGCTPNCSGKVCGSDGCGGSCGNCPSGQTCNASGQCGGTNSCTHPICSTGVKLVSGCDPCVTEICAADSYCCSTKWDNICVGEVSSICGQSCGGCTPNCTGKVCGSDGCGGSCGNCPSGQTCNASGQCGGTNSCTHPICSTGAKLKNGCDPCVTKICSWDSYCCSTKWDKICVQEVGSICGQGCKK